MNIDEAVQLWKEKNIQRCVMEFSCGGDSMGDTEFTFYTNEGEIYDSNLEYYFDHEVYNNVQFYEVSDGEYIGEHGTVTITLDNEDETLFIYDKESVSEVYELVTERTHITISPEEEALFKKISSFEIQDGNITYTYDGDVILSEKEIELLDALESRMVDHLQYYEFNFNEGEPADGGEWSAGFDEIENGILSVHITTSFYVERDSI